MIEIRTCTTIIGLLKKLEKKHKILTDEITLTLIKDSISFFFCNKVHLKKYNFSLVMLVILSNVIIFLPMHTSAQYSIVATIMTVTITMKWPIGIVLA